MTGVETRHGKDCPTRADKTKRCNRKGCSHRGYVYVEGKVERGPRVATADEARSWRINRQNEIAKGQRRTTTDTTLEEAWGVWCSKAEAGTIRNRSGDRYKPSALRGYKGTMRTRVLPQHGGLALSKIDREGLQRLVERLVTDDVSASSIRNTINALRALYRDSDQIIPGGISPDPTVGLRLPSVRSKAKRRVKVSEIAALIDALEERDRAVWATFFYAGLRLGEVQALRWQDLDLGRGVILVPHGWDKAEGRIEPKSRSGVREVPLPGTLRAYLSKPEDADPDGLIFARPDGRAFNPSSLTKRADTTWEKAKLERVTPHQARHAYAALMLAAGTSLKALSEYMGHASITITADEYAYLLEGTETADAARLDSLLAAA